MTAENTHTHASPDAPLAPPPEPPGEPGPTRKRGRLWSFMVDKGVPLLAAILTLVAAILAVWGAKLQNDNDALANDVSSLKDQRSVLSEDNATLTADLADMTTSRDSWKSRAEAAEKAGNGSSTTTTTEPTAVDPGDPPGNQTPDAAGIFRQTGSNPVTFAAGYSIDLDSQESNWSVGSGGDVWLDQVSNGYSLGAYGRVALVSQEATYEQCAAQTVLQHSLTKEQTVVGRQFCTLTSEQRWAYVKIVGLDPDRGTITLHVVVYTLETD